MSFPTINVGLRDHQDHNRGLVLENSNKKRITVRDNLIFCDTRDCVGENSLIDTRGIFKLKGGRSEYSINVTNVTGLSVAPITVTVSEEISSSGRIKNNDKVYISGVQGNTATNGVWKVTNITIISINSSSFELIGSVGNGNYAGGGLVIRKADSGWPILTDETSFIKGNEMIVKLPKKLKVIRSLSLIHAVIPRDIIPLTTYLTDLLNYIEFNDDDVPLGVQVRVATTAAGTLATDFEEGDTIDGIVLAENDRILIKDQAVLSENGIYIVQTSGAPSRSSDMPATTPAVVVLNYYATVSEGTTNKGTTWVCTTATGAVGVGNLTFIQISKIPITWVSYIPQEKWFVDVTSIGFYSTPLYIFRTYIDGSFSIPNQHTPPPLKLWNPPVGGATHQFQPYPHQVVPTYNSANFSVINRTGDFYVILSGYGLYDLNDWTYRLNSNDLVNKIVTEAARKILLLAIVSPQSYKNEDFVSLILNSSTIDSGGLAEDYFGYGDFQRFVPGPGIGMNYQPATTDGADPTVADATNWPIPFPNFRGNVWGPYNSPGDRFQKTGLRDCLQDLYLNGDLSNHFGTSFIKSWVSIENIPSDPTFGINFTIFISTTFGNLRQTTNPNILNAMRLVSNGFGALDVVALGNGETFTNVFLNSGGQGPDINGTPTDGYSAVTTGGAWVNNEILDNAGTGEFGDEIAAGITFTGDGGTATQIVENADATIDGTDTGVAADTINRRRAWYDLGPNNGGFVSQLNNYRDWAITELPDTNIIMNIFQAERDSHTQHMNQEHTSCILSCPIRLNLGTTSGTQEYVENIQSLLAQSKQYWEKRFLAPLQSLYKLSISFTTFEGNQIDLEKMLQPRRSLLILQSLVRVFTSNAALSNILGTQRTLAAGSVLPFLFDPLDPRLVGRTKRNVSLIFNVETYEFESPGMYLELVTEMLETENDANENTHPFMVRASNYQNYT